MCIRKEPIGVFYPILRVTQNKEEIRPLFGGIGGKASSTDVIPHHVQTHSTVTAMTPAGVLQGGFTEQDVGVQWKLAEPGPTHQARRKVVAKWVCVPVCQMYCVYNGIELAVFLSASLSTDLQMEDGEVNGPNWCKQPGSMWTPAVKGIRFPRVRLLGLLLGMWRAWRLLKQQGFVSTGVDLRGMTKQCFFLLFFSGVDLHGMTIGETTNYKDLSHNMGQRYAIVV